MLKGIAAGFMGYGLFSTTDATAKALGARLGVFEILFFLTTRTEEALLHDKLGTFQVFRGIDALHFILVKKTIALNTQA